MNKNIVEIRNGTVDYKMKKYSIRAVNHIDLDIVEGKITALVGESGSGKSTLANSILNALSEPGEFVSGTIKYFGNKDVIEVEKLGHKELNDFRWREISMVFQGAQSALNPIMTIFDQFYETMNVHEKNMTKEEAIKRSIHYLEFVNLDAKRIMAAYPHELSGGMKQRVMIAFSLILEPKLIILDEPTTALDVITQDYIFKLLKKVNSELNISMLLLTHDISVVAKYADYIGVMYGGKMMEYGTVEDVFEHMYHPYTLGLIQSTPSLKKDISLMKPIAGSPPDLMDMPTGCVFNPRCPKVFGLCKKQDPQSHKIGKMNHYVRCHLYEGGKDNESVD